MSIMGSLPLPEPPMPTPILIAPIGHVRGGRLEPLDDAWGMSEAAIELDAGQFGPEALFGLEAFSHIEVLFHFHLADPDAVERGARHPRGRPDWPAVGIFAQRAKDRPNRIGACICEVVAIDGRRLHVRGLDAIDGTPVIDIKPVMAGFLPRSPLREPEWAGELMAGYW